MFQVEGVNRDPAVVFRIKPAHLPGLGAKLALWVFVCFLVPAQAQSLFGAIDPFDTSRKVAPRPDQRWVPQDALPQVPPPVGQQSVPADLNKPVSLAELTEIALSLNVRTRQAWMQARVEAAQSGVDHAGDFPQITGTLSDRIARPISATSGFPNTTLIDQGGNSAAAANGGRPYSVFTTYGPTLSLSYVLFDFGKRAADKEATEYRLLAANLAQNRTLQDVAFQVEQAYYRVLGFEQLVHKILQQLQADLLAFLRVKLRGENIVAPDGRRERFAVVRARRDDGRIHRLRKKTVDEINVAAAWNVTKKRTVRLRQFKLVPADLRNLQARLFGKADDFAFEKSPARRRNC